MDCGAIILDIDWFLGEKINKEAVEGNLQITREHLKSAGWHLADASLAPKYGHSSNFLTRGMELTSKNGLGV